MKVLLLHENQTYDPYITKPVIEGMFEAMGRKATVEPLRRPNLHGVDQVLKLSVLTEIIENNPMVRVFIALVDRDGVEGRAARATALEEAHPGKLVITLAIEELEVWMLALHRDKLGDARWQDVRAEPHPKEVYAAPLLEMLAVSSGPGGGRKAAMRALAGQWHGLLQRCEEIAELQRKLERLLLAP